MGIMAKNKRKARNKERIALESKFGPAKTKDILNRKKDQRTKFERVTEGLDAAEIESIEKEQVPVSHKGRKFQERYNPKRKEDPKIALFVKGNNCGEEVSTILKRLALSRGFAAANETRKKRQDIHPMDDDAYPLNILCSKQAHILALGTKTKKRPKCLTLVRRFGTELLDKAEFLVSNIKDHGPWKLRNASKALVITQGALWHGRYEMDTIRSMLVDLFYGFVCDQFFITGIERLVVLTALPNANDPLEVPVINIRQYTVSYKASPDANPAVELTPTCMEFDLSLCRINAADDRVMKMALRVPREEHTVKSKPLEAKTLERDDFGNIVGRVYVRQTLEKIQK